MNNILILGVLTGLISGCNCSSNYTDSDNPDFYCPDSARNVIAHEAITLNKNLQLIIEELHIMNQAIREKK